MWKKEINRRTTILISGFFLFFILISNRRGRTARLSSLLGVRNRIYLRLGVRLGRYRRRRWVIKRTWRRPFFQATSMDNFLKKKNDWYTTFLLVKYAFVLVFVWKAIWNWSDEFATDICHVTVTVTKMHTSRENRSRWKISGKKILNWDLKKVTHLSRRIIFNGNELGRLLIAPKLQVKKKIWR